MRIGRWSEPRFVFVCQLVKEIREADANETLGELGLVLPGNLVGESQFRIPKLVPDNMLSNIVPLESVELEYHDEWCALKFFRGSLLHVTPVRNLLSHLQVDVDVGTAAMCFRMQSMLPFITANNLWMEISRTYATKETTSRLQATLCWVLTNSGLRLIPISSSPLEHIHHVLCHVVSFRQAGTCLLI